jgi:prephenate dehydrogenase
MIDAQDGEALHSRMEKAKQARDNYVAQFEVKPQPNSSL